jgi:phosphocarrier protein HPr
MMTFQYTIKEKEGIHARPAAMLVKAAKETDSKITIQKDEKSAEATKLMAIMAMGIKCGDVVSVSVEEGNEEQSFCKMKEFFENNL